MPSASTNLQSSSAWATNIAKLAFLSLTAIVFCSAIYLIRAELNAIILGSLLASVLMPFHRRIRRLVERMDFYFRNQVLHQKPPKEKERRRFYETKIQGQIRRRAAILSVALVFLIIVIPVTLFTIQLAKQGMTTLRSTAIWLEKELPSQVPQAIEAVNRHELARKFFLDFQLFTVSTSSDTEDEGLQHLMPPMSNIDSANAGELELASPEEDSHSSHTDNVPAKIKDEELPRIDPQKVTSVLVNASRTLLSGALKLLVKILSKTWLTVFNFFLMLFVMFFVFYDGENIMSYARSIIPLEMEEQRQVIQRIREVSSSIAFSILGTALCQSIIAMIIFRIVGIPALFWGVMLGMCSIIPVVGTTLIWIPASLYLFATGQTWQGWFVFCSCGLLVANIDNLLRPLIMKKTGKTGMSYLVLFFAILGGLQTFGLVGIIYGPLIFGICGICLLLFSTQFKKKAIMNQPTAERSTSE
ncbi:MAG: AI-2E family transporter [Victivallales bacterium]|nr:AI-2E family transporter [Victivallales bacterium]MBQ6473910.1 AI-2E family transporter [Victivallales bacterium]